MEFITLVRTAEKHHVFVVNGDVSISGSGVQLLSAWSEFSISTAFAAVCEGIRCE